MIAGRGWKAQFGRVLTPEEFSSLKDKVAALKAHTAGNFEGRIFLTGLISNSALAASLTFVGDKLGVDLSIAAIVAFGVRIFNNLASVRRHYL